MSTQEDGPFEYSPIDLISPLGPTKYLPRILGEQDPVIRYYETAVNALLTTANIVMYYGLSKLLLD